MEKNNYKSFCEKIAKSTYLDSITLHKSLDRLWNAGIFTVSELQKLDAKICDLSIKSDVAQNNLASHSI
jgi:hypothetical protein